MEIVAIFKPTKWFFLNKGLINKLSHPLPRLIRFNSNSSSRSASLCPPSPIALPSPTLGNCSSKEDQLQEVFRRFDRDGDGKISSEELSAYFQSVGDELSRDEAQRVIKDFDNDGDNLLEFKEFLKLIEGDKNNQEGDDDDDIKGAFEMYEGDKGCGCITPTGLQKMLNRLGDAKSYEECVAIIRVFDLDGNGVLDFHEFQQMMRGN